MSGSRDIDGGWAWVILWACSFCVMVTSGLACLAGMFQKVFLEELDGDVVMTTWITSLYASLMQLAGPVTGVVCSVLGCRTSVMAGSVLLTAGLLLSALCRDLSWLLLSFGISSGLGLGLIYSAAIVTVNLSFVHYRPVASGSVLAAGGVGIMVFPALCRHLLAARGAAVALLILAAVAAQLAVAGALFFPVRSLSRSSRSRSRSWWSLGTRLCCCSRPGVHGTDTCTETKSYTSACKERGHESETSERLLKQRDPETADHTTRSLTVTETTASSNSKTENETETSSEGACQSNNQLVAKEGCRYSPDASENNHQTFTNTNEKEYNTHLETEEQNNEQKTNCLRIPSPRTPSGVTPTRLSNSHAGLAKPNVFQSSSHQSPTSCLSNSHGSLAKHLTPTSRLSNSHASLAKRSAFNSSSHIAPKSYLSNSLANLVLAQPTLFPSASHLAYLSNSHASLARPNVLSSSSRLEPTTSLSNSHASLARPNDVLSSSPYPAPLSNSQSSLAHAQPTLFDSSSRLSASSTKFWPQLRAVLPSPSLIMICLQLFLSNAATGIVLVHYVEFCLATGTDFGTVSLSFSVNGLTLTVARFLLGVLAQDRNIDPLCVYVGLALVASLICVMIPVLAVNGLAQVLMMGSLGAYAGGSYALLTEITIHCTGVDTLSLAFGLEMISAGLGFLVAPPIAAWMVVLTRSYSNAMFLAGCLYFVSAIVSMAIAVVRPVWKPTDNCDGIAYDVTATLADEEH